MDKLTAKDLKRRYRAGERNFAGVDLSSESLRGMNLKGINLAGADLSYTDIRGTNFTKANLTSTQFVAAKAGTRRRWLVPQLLIALTLVALSSYLAGFIWFFFGNLSSDNNINILLSLSGIVFSPVILGLIYARGVLTLLGVALGAIVVALPVNFASSFYVGSGIAYQVIMAVAAAVVIAVAIAIAIAATIAVGGAIAAAVATTIAIAAAFFSIVSMSHNEPTIVPIVGILANFIINFLVSRRAIKGDSRDALIRNLAVWLSSWGGTKFVAANLTEVSFQGATLKSAYLYRTNLTRANFHLAKKGQPISI